MLRFQVVHVTVSLQLERQRAKENIPLNVTRVKNENIRLVASVSECEKDYVRVYDRIDMLSLFIYWATVWGFKPVRKWTNLILRSELIQFMEDKVSSGRNEGIF